MVFSDSGRTDGGFRNRSAGLDLAPRDIDFLQDQKPAQRAGERTATPKKVPRELEKCFLCWIYSAYRNGGANRMDGITHLEEPGAAGDNQDNHVYLVNPPRISSSRSLFRSSGDAVEKPKQQDPKRNKKKIYSAVYFYQGPERDGSVRTEELNGTGVLLLLWLLSGPVGLWVWRLVPI